MGSSVGRPRPTFVAGTTSYCTPEPNDSDARLPPTAVGGNCAHSVCAARCRAAGLNPRTPSTTHSWDDPDERPQRGGGRLRGVSCARAGSHPRNSSRRAAPPMITLVAVSCRLHGSSRRPHAGRGRTCRRRLGQHDNSGCVRPWRSGPFATESEYRSRFADPRGRYWKGCSGSARSSGLDRACGRTPAAIRP